MSFSHSNSTVVQRHQRSFWLVSCLTHACISLLSFGILHTHPPKHTYTATYTTTATQKHTHTHTHTHTNTHTHTHTHTYTHIHTHTHTRKGGGMIDRFWARWSS